MKKEKMLLWILLLVLGLAGCASGEAAPEQVITMATEGPEAASVLPEKGQEIAFLFQDTLVTPGMALPREVEAAAITQNQVSTCVGSGMETVYQYEGFDITVHNNSTSDPVYSIYFLTSEVSTTEGLSIGDSTEKAREMYGEPDTQGGFTWIYSDGTTDLILLVADDAVAGIEYRMTD